LSLSQNSFCLIQIPGSLAHKRFLQIKGGRETAPDFQPAPGLTDSCHKRSVTPAGIAFQPVLGRQAPEQIRALASTDQLSFKDNLSPPEAVCPFFMDAAAQHTELPGPAGYPPLWKTLASPQNGGISPISKKN